MLRARALLVPLAVALASCGGDDEPARTAAATTPDAPGAIRIAEPAGDERVRAREDGGRLGRRLAVAGTADPGSEVVLTGGCNVQGCVVDAPVDAEGRFRAELRVDAPAGEPEVTITAYYRGLVVGPEDKVELRLAGPRPERVRDGGAGGGRGGGGGGGSSRPVTPPDTLDPQPIPSSPGPGRDGPHVLTLIGDSLAEGIEPRLPAELPGWRIEADALTSRPLDAGMGILARTRVPAGSVVAMSLFTNDDPSRTGALEAAVRTSVRRAGPGGCAIWATIARPPFNGRSYAAANALLRRLDAELGARLTVVPWAENAARNGWLAGDAVHGTPEGYAARARMYAEAAKACG